jgi:hypothetical protein
MRNQPSVAAWLTALEGGGPRTALVVADQPLAGALADLCRSRGYDVLVPLLLAKSERLGPVLISAKARIAAGLQELLADEYPQLDRVVLAA